jgi:hypothetical protein
MTCRSIEKKCRICQAKMRHLEEELKYLEYQSSDITTIRDKGFLQLRLNLEGGRDGRTIRESLQRYDNGDRLVKGH